jgi:hypothetical protein
MNNEGPNGGYCPESIVMPVPATACQITIKKDLMAVRPGKNLVNPTYRGYIFILVQGSVSGRAYVQAIQSHLFDNIEPNVF